MELESEFESESESLSLLEEFELEPFSELDFEPSISLDLFQSSRTFGLLGAFSEMSSFCKFLFLGRVIYFLLYLWIIVAEGLNV